MNYLLAILYNEKLKRYHPIAFVEAPFPGGSDNNSGTSTRFKSTGHHTEGFETHEEAIEDCKDKVDCLPGGQIWDGDLIGWNGEGIPAIKPLASRGDDGKMTLIL